MTDRTGTNDLKDQNTISTSFGPFRLRSCFPFFQKFLIAILPLNASPLLHPDNKFFGACSLYPFSRHKTSLP